MVQERLVARHEEVRLYALRSGEHETVLEVFVDALVLPGELDAEESAHTADINSSRLQSPWFSVLTVRSSDCSH